jgi:hypothetical protein
MHTVVTFALTQDWSVAAIMGLEVLCGFATIGSVMRSINEN